MLRAGARQLHLAAEQDNPEAVLALIKDGSAVDCRDSQGNTALHVAAAHDSAGAARLLLQCGAQLNSTNSAGWTALMQAARHGRQQAVALLLQHGADVLARTVMGVTALGLAAVGGRVAVLRQLLDAGASTTDGQLSPVLLGAQEGQDVAVRLLLDRGSSANTAAACTGVTPLMACCCGAASVSTAELLLARGADPDLTSVANLTALQVAQQGDHQQLVALLAPLTSVNKHLNSGVVTAVDAVQLGDLAALHAILDQDPEQARAASSQGVTALMAAAVLGRDRCAQLLLQRGAEVNAVDSVNGWTPLLHALYNRHLSLARLLLSHGADITFVTPKGYTAFDFASDALDREIMKAYAVAQDTSSSGGSDDSWQPHPQLGVASPHTTLQRKQGRRWWNRVANRFQKVKGDRDLCDVGSSSLVLDLSLPPGPLLTGEPILPNLPPRTPLHMFPAEDVHREGFAPAALRACAPPLDLTGSSLRWSSELSALSQGRLILPGKQAPKFADTRLLLQRLNDDLLSSGGSQRGGGAGGGSSTPSSSLTASTNTTVKTRRSNATTRHRDHAKHSPPAPRVVDQLTLSLGSRQLSQVLEKLALADQAPAFHDQDVDFDAFLELNNDDLLELGVADQVTRVKILRAIKSLRRKV